MEGRDLMGQSLIVPVREITEVASARRAALQVAQSLRFSETMAGRVALAATELATNLVKHAEEGSLIIGVNDERPGTIDVLTIDKGKGIPNVDMALRDGFSTAGSYGNGLGSLSRMASLFDVYSTASGTAILCRIEDPERVSRSSPDVASRAGQLQIAGICVPIPSESEPRDAWAALRSEGRVTVAVADGLGHGASAAEASNRAIRVFKESNQHEPSEILRAMHDPLRATRGAAVAVARIHLDRGLVEFVGIGNISGIAAGEEASRRMVSLNGIVGHEMRKVQPFTYPWTSTSLMIMHSDGLSANWTLTSYPGLAQHDEIVIAAVLFRDHCRRTDDATVVVVKP